MDTEHDHVARAVRVGVPVFAHTWDPIPGGARTSTVENGVKITLHDGRTVQTIVDHAVRDAGGFGAVKALRELHVIVHGMYERWHSTTGESLPGFMSANINPHTGQKEPGEHVGMEMVMGPALLPDYGWGNRLRAVVELLESRVGRRIDGLHFDYEANRLSVGPIGDSVRRVEAWEREMGRPSHFRLWCEEHRLTRWYFGIPNAERQDWWVNKHKRLMLGIYWMTRVRDRIRADTAWLVERDPGPLITNYWYHNTVAPIYDHNGHEYPPHALAVGNESCPVLYINEDGSNVDVLIGKVEAMDPRMPIRPWVKPFGSSRDAGAERRLWEAIFRHPGGVRGILVFNPGNNEPEQIEATGRIIEELGSVEAE